MWYRSLYYLKKAFDTLKYNSEKLSNFQNRQFQTISKTCKSISYYQDKWPEDSSIESEEDLNKLPIIESQSFRSNQEKMNQFTNGGFTRETSGTTGEPVSVKFNTQAYDWLSAIYMRTLWIHGYRPRKSVSQYWREPEDNRTFIGKKLMPVNYISSERSLTEQIDSLEKNDSDVLKYFPQVLLALCKKMNSEGEADIDPDLILTYGELLTPSMREYIENTFDAPIFDHYATTEFGVVAWECPEGGYHITEDSVYAEVVDSEGNKIANGESGKLVLTGLVNTDTALVRYDIEDIVEITDQSCSCNTSFKRIDRIRGREDDIIFNTKGEPVFPDQLIDIIAPVEEILFFQVVANDEQYKVKYVANTDFEEDLLEKVARELNSKLSLEPLQLVEVEDIPRSEGGKLRVIENNQSQLDNSNKIF